MTNIVEIIARAMVGKGLAPHSSTLKKAAAVQRALHDAGYAIVPLEPTEAMRTSGGESMQAAREDDWRDDASDIYRAMINAGKGEG
ncbi:hypothetical protein [Sphingopyxis sp. JAI128]|uniref:hypothetical protein n=1 Tax=Sphingopyxis sp. JAI128 TaxID=2723066 RepID=UPI001612D317|nr:hypothetical protein [Sphingopyxis sp. JAI128]MBB6424964.1 putative CoA-binding protein [Sphingopyxis sp. JAI128]